MQAIAAQMNHNKSASYSQSVTVFPVESDSES